jgi:hypothetical protein
MLIIFSFVLSNKRSQRPLHTFSLFRLDLPTKFALEMVGGMRALESEDCFVEDCEVALSEALAVDSLWRVTASSKSTKSAEAALLVCTS